MWETDWNERLHLKSHTSLLYSRWKTVCELSSMSDFTVFIKQINYYFWQDTEVCIQWAVYYPVRPQERFCEWQWSDTTDTHGSHDNDSSDKCSMHQSRACDSLSSCHETSRRFLRYGNSFPSTFPEVLLAHASQMTGQLSQSMQIWRARDSINAMPATIILESSTSPWIRDGFSV